MKSARSVAARVDVPTTHAARSEPRVERFSRIASCSVGCSPNSTKVSTWDLTAVAMARSKRTMLRRFQNQYCSSGVSLVIGVPSVAPMQSISEGSNSLTPRRSTSALRISAPIDAILLV